MELPEKGEDASYIDQGVTHTIELNGHGFTGEFTFKMAKNTGSPTFTVGKYYTDFDVIIRLETPEQSGNGAPMRRTPDNTGYDYMVYPLNITGEGVQTGVQSITDKTVAREVVGVEYYNVAGQRSDKPFEGVNIIVTRYDDGTTSTAKVLK